ncbi:MAG TPA: hypothetical protein VH599_07235 [Ktedonobacterales bacterium]|jgi:hypothetical protein
MDKILRKVADVLEKSISGVAASVELVLIDLVFGKAKYRRHGPKMRPIIHRTYNKTVIVREPLERVHIVKTRH